MINNNNPVVLIFDLDETLFNANLMMNGKYKGYGSLSDSCEIFTSKANSVGTTKVKLCGPLDPDTDEVKAIARKRMKRIFKDIVNVQKQAVEKKAQMPIHIKIMTAGTYDANAIYDVLNRFYFSGNKIIGEQVKAEFFNKSNLDLTLLQKNKNGKLYDFRKAKLIDKNFEDWSKVIPGLLKENVILIDNAIQNINGVNEYGYTGYHYPTTSKNNERNLDDSYTEGAEIVFKNLETIIKNAKLALAQQ